MHDVRVQNPSQAPLRRTSRRHKTAGVDKLSCKHATHVRALPYRSDSPRQHVVIETLSMHMGTPHVELIKIVADAVNLSIQRHAPREDR